MRSPVKTRLLKGALLVGAVVGFGSGFHQMSGHCSGRHGYADALTRVCVDAALGRDTGDAEARGHGGHRAQWVAERCAAHAREAKPKAEAE